MLYFKRIWLILLLLSGQAFADISILTNRFVLDAKLNLLTESASAAGFNVNILLSDDLTDEQLLQQLQHTSLLIVDIPRATDFLAIQQRLQPLATRLPQQQLWVGRTEKQAKGFKPEQAETLWQYYRHGGEHNFRHFFRYLAALNNPTILATIPAPVIIPAMGAYHPDFPARFSADPDQVLQFLQRKNHKAASNNVVAVGFHARYLESGAMAHIDAITKALEQHGLVALPVFYTLGPDANLTQLLQHRAQALLHLQPVYHNGLLPHLQQLDIPVLQGIGWWTGDEQDWRKHSSGLSLASTPLYLALPEQNGLSDPLVLWTEHQGVLMPIREQVEAVSNKLAGLIALQQTADNKRQLAVMFYNYPPGEKNMSASFMNVPRSLAALSQQWQQQGYIITPFSEQQAIDTLGQLIQGLHQPTLLPQLAQQNLAASLPLSQYLQWYNALPQDVRQRIEARWGVPEQSPYLSGTADQQVFLIPRWQNGNIFMLPQPPRGMPEADQERSLYHDLRLPVNHYYLATYLWLRQQSGAHALIHFGTHGTQEWMPGKERGLSTYDDPLLALGDIPVVYPYIVDNTGEATQAKRRGRATMVSHQTPLFQPSGLHGGLLEIHQLIHQYQQLDEGEVKQLTLQRLQDTVVNDPIMKDLNWQPEQVNTDTERFISELHVYLHSLAAQAQPLGLHSFATSGPQQQQLTTIMQMLGNDFIFALGMSEPEEVFATDYTLLPQTLPYRWLESVLGYSKQPPEPALPQWQEKAKQFAGLLDPSTEFSGLQQALSGHFVTPSVGGDPLRVTESLPTGKNLYGFDPARIPTKEAWQAGKAAITELLQNHKAQHGKWPEKLAFSLWAVEAMRHGGVLESEALYAIGVEPVWDRAGRVTGYTVLSTEQLGRPRVDVVLSSTGLYRDQFPNMMAHFAKATEEVSLLAEVDNPIYRNTERLLADLLQQGMNEKDARYFASTRVFGSPTGVYGTGLDNAVQASDSYNDDSKLAQLYLSRMSYAFGPDPERWGQDTDTSSLFAENLKGVDAALLARTSNLYGMLTTDDPFQYLGGIDLAVRHLTGRSPALYISNQRQAGKARIESASRFLAAELSTRVFHPGWIKAMQQEGFAGALNLQDITANLWGWQVVSPDMVRNDQWQKLHDVYVNDSLQLDINEWFAEHAPEAQARMMERMLEAIRKQYWDAPEQTLTELLQAYLELTAKYDIQAGNDAIAEFVKQQASGFGLSIAAQNNAAQQAGSEGQQVSGQQLQQVSNNSTEQPRLWYLPLLLLLPLSAGFFRQHFSALKRSATC
ncbi:cobaltochelatase subunit CobN [Rheinheimera aquimaris]|uniref:cobaltochelatase subunit CobN n=1 Tax=Rheinheimera aquimaris TaxID=412437 RepID=UPI0010652799|nr:cobaltochelatase subunit CobN [Rheinheimera aquimaris]